MADAPAVFEVFADAGSESGIITRHPVGAHPEITVTHAARGSGMVTFELDGASLMYLSDKDDSPKPNSMMSIPAGTTADDILTLALTYMPDGEMGEGEFEIRLPSGWGATEILTVWLNTPGDDAEESNGVLTATFPENFGKDSNDALRIRLEGVSTTNRHGNHRFIARSKSEDDTTLARLNPTPMVFVGNTVADHDTVTVEITPKAVYPGEGIEVGTADKESVDFEITLTATGPMYNSEITIITPSDLDDVQGDSTKKGYVRKKSASGRDVTVTPDSDGRNINITIGELNDRWGNQSYL